MTEIDPTKLTAYAERIVSDQLHCFVVYRTEDGVAVYFKKRAHEIKALEHSRAWNMASASERAHLGGPGDQMHSVTDLPPTELIEPHLLTGQDIES